MLKRALMAMLFTAVINHYLSSGRPHFPSST
jgi:hypothetical protein